MSKELHSKYLQLWEQFVIPELIKKDYESAKYEADNLISNLLFELKYDTIAYKFWKLR